MAGTKAGGIKAAETNRRNNPNFYSEIGKRGGASGRGHTFAHGKADPAVAGRLGGKRSKRGSKND